MPFKWSRDLIEKLITEIKQNPCIYNIKSKYYLNRNCKAQAYNSILKNIQIENSSITLEEIKRKWKNLRTQYSQELRLINQANCRPGSNDVYVPKLWCYKQLSFLNMHIEVRKSVKYAELGTYESKSSTCSSQEGTVNDEPPKKKPKIPGAVNVFHSKLDNFKNILAQRKSPKRFAWLGNLVTCQMEHVHPDYQADAAWKVQCLMRHLIKQSMERRRTESSNSKDNACQSTSKATTPLDILELSMEEIFDEKDFNESFKI